MIIFIDPITHCKENGGTYWNHLSFAFKKSALMLFASFAGFIHAIFPFLLPFVAEQIIMENGVALAKRRDELKALDRNFANEEERIETLRNINDNH